MTMNKEARIDCYNVASDRRVMEGLSYAIADWRAEKQFYTPASIETDIDKTEMNSKLMLVVTEVAEASEALRHGDLEGFKEELADTFIRLLDITGSMHLGIDGIIASKMKKNEERPIKHGKAL